MRYRILSCLLILSTAGCAGAARTPLATAAGPLSLDRVVLYRNGVGYFERTGHIEDGRLTLRVRKDQVNDLLKSLTVIDRKSGHVLSVSMPLDPQAWQRAALGALTPGNGQLAEVLDALRGTEVVVEARGGGARGRIVMVEPLDESAAPRHDGAEPVTRRDHRLTLLDGDSVQVVRLSKVRRIELHDGDLALQLHRHLDASAGEGMFQQVDVSIALGGQGPHDLLVSYVSEAPLWKPTYRVVLGEAGSGEALLQAWAVVDNVSGENWQDVKLSLTSGAPIAFRYDLHTPERIERTDMTPAGSARRAAVSVGDASLGEEIVSMGIGAAVPMEDEEADYDDGAMLERGMSPPAPRESKAMAKRSMSRPASAPAPAPEAARPPMLTQELMQGSMQAQVSARRVSGLTQFDLKSRVSVPDGSATMVALINEKVRGEQSFLFRPGGSGPGYEVNPYRVVRFHNSTDFVLEPGPISIYSGGSFVGEGLAQAVGSKDTITVPFAVEPSIAVRSSSEYAAEELRVTRIVHGVIEAESFQRYSTVWSVKGPHGDAPYRVLVRHPRQGGNYKLVAPTEGIEELADAYLVPVDVAKGATAAEVKVVEETPSRVSLSIWDGRVPELLQAWLAAGSLDAAARKALEPIVALRQKMGRIDTEIGGLSDQQNTLNQRAEETRENLQAIKKDPKAAALRKQLGERMDQFTREADALGRRIVELQSEHLQTKIAIEDALIDLKLETLSPANR